MKFRLQKNAVAALLRPSGPIPKGPVSISAPAAAIRRFLDERRHELQGRLDSVAGAGVGYAQRHSDIMDGLLLQLFSSATSLLPEAERGHVLLAAVGGYGRRLVGAKSDLDVRFVTQGSADRLKPFVESMLYPLWDSGVSIGHQVVNVKEAVKAAAGDLPTATALLDFRPLVGDMTLYEDLSARAFGSVFGSKQLPGFIARLEHQAEERYERFGDSVYLLEPDVKNGTGGLRDLDLALWAARARFRTGNLSQLQEIGIVSARQVEEIARATDFLWAVRNHLHLRAGRRSDRLTFGEQEAIAPLLGYAAPGDAGRERSDVERLGATVETFMSDYYRHSRNIMLVRDQVIGRAKRRDRRSTPKSKDLGQGVLSCEGGVGLCDPEDLARDPALALRMYTTAVAKDMPVLAHSRDAVMHAASDPAFGEALRADARAAAQFVSLVTTCKPSKFRNGSILGELHEVGLLLAMIPEFAPVVGRVHHDMYHVYTVDVHSVAAIDRLRALVRGELVKTQALACRLAAGLERPETLFMATLLHDVGKSIGGHDHSRRGAVMARPILARLGFAAADIEDACHLIERHLAMYLVAVQRDLADPSTIDEFVRECRSREGLRDLFLLTVADLSTTSPTSMTKWKAEMLDELMRRSDARLSGELAEGHNRALKVRAEVKHAWSQRPRDGAIEQFLDTMPERYMLSNSPAAILAHAVAALHPRGQSVTATLVPSADHSEVAELCVVTDNSGSSELCVVAADRPGLLASIAAAISANGLEIHAAQINTRPLPDGGVQAVDVFWVRSAARGHAGIRDRMPKLERTLRDLVAGQVQAKDLLDAHSRSNAGRERSMPSVSTEIVIDDRASTHYTVIEVVTADRPALLYTLAQALYEIGVSIHVAKINTEGSRVIDVFYVTETDGKKLAQGARIDTVREALQAAMRPREVTAVLC